ncbi:MAG: STAS domain-containing protein [Qingshengfaniella sp.]
MDIFEKLTGGPAPVLILTPDGQRIDAAAAIAFKDRMRQLTATGPDRVVLDLSAVQFLDSSGLGAIVASLKQMRDGQTLELAGARDMVAKVLNLTRMDKVFRIHDSADFLDGGMPV